MKKILKAKVIDRGLLPYKYIFTKPIRETTGERVRRIIWETKPEIEFLEEYGHEVGLKLIQKREEQKFNPIISTVDIIRLFIAEQGGHVTVKILPPEGRDVEPIELSEYHYERNWHDHPALAQLTLHKLLDRWNLEIDRYEEN